MLDKFIHKTLRVPYRLFVAHDRRVENETITLVLWHGIGSSYRVWTKTINEISHNSAFDNARLVTIDLLGFGKSPAPSWCNYTTDDHLHALRRTLKSLRIKTPIILVGHSMGSLLAVEYSTVYPEKIAALALVSPPFLQPKESKALLNRFYHKAYDKILTAKQTKQLEQVASFFEKFTSFEADSIGQESLQRSMKHVVIGSRTLSQVKKLKLPIHLFHGSLDILVNGANLKPLSKKANISFHASPIGHDVVGLKRKQLIKVLSKLVSE